MVSNAVLPTTNRPDRIIGQGVADINIARQTFSFWHINATAATFIPIFERVIESLRRLHSVSCIYLPVDTPTPISYKPPETLCRHDSEPLLIRLGDMAVLAGMRLAAPAPL